MIRGIAVETSGRIGSVALCEGDAVVVEERFPHGLQHAARIVSVLDSLLQQKQWPLASIERVYVSAGPGSFTGLRIGVTLAKTLTLTRPVRVVAVPTVCVLAENAPDAAKHLVIVLDAKREQIFTASFERDDRGAWAAREPARLDRLDGVLARSPRPIYLLGEGIPYHQKFIDLNDTGVIVTDAALWRARAAAVGRLGWAMAQRGEFADPLHLSPIYVRRPEAEEKWLAAQAAAQAGADPKAVK